MPNGTFQRLALCGVLLALSACEAPAPRATAPAVTPVATATAPVVSLEEVNALLEKAASSNSPDKEYYLLEAAKALHSNNKAVRARKLLDAIDSDMLTDENFVGYTLLFSEISMAEDSLFLAQRILTNPRLEQQWKLMPKEARITLRKRRTELFEQLGKAEASISERLAMESSLLSGSEQSINLGAIWSTLMELPLQTLQAKAKATGSEEIQRGWYTLAAAIKACESDLEAQQTALARWLESWPGHPASYALPQELQMLEQLIAARPQRVAILLPQQGELENAGRAISEGFLASYYKAHQRGSNVPELRFYDTGSGDTAALYDAAIAAGAELVIGPLDKGGVDALASRPSLPVPTLAVNYTKDGASTPPELFQFGLAVEDEARQAARRAWREGFRHPLIMAVDAPWAQRSAEAFRSEWQILGGEVSAIKTFQAEGDYSSLIASTLLIRASQDRAEALRRAIGRQLVFAPRRRQDMDMIFLAATPSQGRQVKPMLAYHYASSMPVYASSQVYSGIADPKRDIDLNDVRFSTLPWNFSASPLKRQINALSKPAPGYQQLYALGVDTYQLYQRLLLLQATTDNKLHGYTGALSLGPHNRIQREQTWAEFRDGNAVALPASLEQDIP